MLLRKKITMLFAGTSLVVSLACGLITGTSTPIPPTEAPPKLELTPTPQPQPEPTLESSGIGSSQPVKEKFYTQDFDEPINNWTYVLTSGNEKKLDIGVVEGYLVFDLTDQELWEYTLYDEFVYTNVRVDVRVENIGSNDHEINLICRYDEIEGWWELNVTNGGLYRIRFGKWDDNRKSASYTKIANGASTFFKTGRSVNDIGFECNDQELVLYINGEETVRTKDTNHFLLKGQIGIGVSSFFDPNVRVRYDWVKISEP